MSSAAIKTGYLNKQGNSYKNWKRRYFVLSKTHLAYYKQPNDPTPLGVVELNASHVAAGGEKVNGFKVTTPGRTFFFQADTQSDMSEWVEAVKSISDNLLMKNIDNSHMIESKSGTHQGYLFKKGNDVLKGWNKRWFHLKRDSLTYYKTKEQTVPLGVLPLLNCTVKATNTDNRYGFEVKTGSRTYYMYTDSQEDQKKWVSSIEAAIQSIKETHNELPTTPTVGTNNSSNTSSNSSSTNTNIPTSSSSNSGGSSSGPPSPSSTPVSSFTSSTSSPLSSTHSATFSTPATNGPSTSAIQTPTGSGSESSSLTSSHSPTGSAPSSPSPIPQALQASRRDSLAAMRDGGHSGSDVKIIRSQTTQPLKKQTSAILMRHKSNSILKVKDPVNSNLKTLREGYLTKMGHNMLKDWKRRWCVLQVGSLYYYKNKDDVPAGQIKLVTCRVRENEKVRPLCIEFVTPNRNYFMYADSPEDFQAWLKDLNTACTSVMEQFLEVDSSNTAAPHTHTSSNNNNVNNSNNVIKEVEKKSKKSELERFAGRDLRGDTLLKTATQSGFLVRIKHSKPPKMFYTILKDDLLFFYDSDQQTETPTGVLSVVGSTVRGTEGGEEEEGTQIELTFPESLGPKKKYVFRTDTSDHTHVWLRAFTVAAALPPHGAPPSPKTHTHAHTPPTSTPTPTPLPNATPAPSPSGGPTSMSSTSAPTSGDGSSAPNEILKEYISKPENNMSFCAECGFPEARWASINLGIMLCIECSGSHRSLGVHISQVRSVDLDNWNMEAVSFMLSMGNNKSNAIWEHSLPENYKKPLPNDPWSLKEKWIRQKYVEKIFADPNIISKDKVEKKASVTPNFSKEGYLTKCGFSVKSWKRRWFILKPIEKTVILSYYKNRGDPNPAGQIILAGSEIVLSTTRPNAFEITTPNRTFTCIADTLAEAETWLARLKTALEFIKDNE